MVEEWRDVPGWEGLYQVSDLGRVKSLERVIQDVTGKVLVKKERILNRKPSKSTGYKYTTLTLNGTSQVIPVHRLVALAFHPNPSRLPLVRHLNDIKTDNRAVNLAWGTPSDNGDDSVRNGGHRMFKVTHCPKGHEYSEDNTHLNYLGRRECKTCREQWVKVTTERRLERGLSDDDPRHGTYNGYVHFKCRCEPCKQARREFARGKREGASREDTN